MSDGYIWCWKVGNILICNVAWLITNSGNANNSKIMKLPYFVADVAVPMVSNYYSDLQAVLSVDSNGDTRESWIKIATINNQHGDTGSLCGEFVTPLLP